MEANIYFIIFFFGLASLRLLYCQLRDINFHFQPLAARWLRKHLILPRVLHGQHPLNPTRAVVLCHFIHWAAMIVFNTFKVPKLDEAASRAALAAVVHLFPLVAVSQLRVASRTFSVSPSTCLQFHRALGIMATVQGFIHGGLMVANMDGWTWFVKLGIVTIAGLAALSCFPLVRRCAYETFLTLHRALTIVASVALWLHLPRGAVLAQRMCLIAICISFATFLLKHTIQIRQNLGPLRQGFQLPRIREVRKHDEYLILAIHLPRKWNLHPGQHVYLSVLTLRYASMLQRHPFTITWWEEQPQQNLIYVMIRPRQGWTKSIMRHTGFLDNRLVWLDGPYGSPLRLEDYGTVLLFASGDGIFAQLPLLKALTDSYRQRTARTRRIKLVWLTSTFNEQVQEWIQSLLDDRYLDISLFVICVHTPNSPAYVAGSPRIDIIGRRVKVIYDVPDIRGYLQPELKHQDTEIAIAVSGSSQLRHNVRSEVLRMQQSRMRLFELDFQPHDNEQYHGGVAI